jgi:hypothetical protein
MVMMLAKALYADDDRQSNFRREKRILLIWILVHFFIKK